PYFAGDVSVRLGLLDELVPVDPERMRDVARHVEAPAVDAFGGIAIRREPAFGDREDGFARAVREAELSIFLQNRQMAAGSVPRAIVQTAWLAEKFVVRRQTGRPLFDFEPVGIPARLAVSHHVLKERMRLADVIKYAVDDHLEALLVRFLDEVEEDAIAL